MSKTSYSRENNIFPKNSIFNIFWKNAHKIFEQARANEGMVFSGVVLDSGCNEGSLDPKLP